MFIILHFSSKIYPLLVGILQLSRSLNTFTVTVSWTKQRLCWIFWQNWGRKKTPKTSPPPWQTAPKKYEHIFTWQNILTLQVGTVIQTEWVSWQTMAIKSGYCRDGASPKSFVCTVAFDVVSNIQLFPLKGCWVHIMEKKLSMVFLKALSPFIFIANTAGHSEWMTDEQMNSKLRQRIIGF